MSFAISADPVKKAWKLGDYAACIALIESGTKPRPSTLRHLLAPRQLWIAKNTCSLRLRTGPYPSLVESFHEALLMLIQEIPALEQASKAIYGQIKSNHLHFLTFFTVSEMIRGGGSPSSDLRLDTAISILTAISPSCLAAKSHSPCFGPDDSNVQRFLMRPNQDDNLWSEACRMPPHSAKLFLDASLSSIERRGGRNKSMRLSFHADEAWRRLLKSEHTPLRVELRAESIKLQAQVARARHREALIDGIQQLSSKMLREAVCAGERSLAMGIMNDSFSILKIICQRHSFDGAPLPSSALFGEHFARMSSVRRFTPPNRLSRDDGSQEVARAQIFLDWLEASAAFAAELSLAPMSGSSIRGISDAYLSLAASGIIFPHDFPTGAPSLEAAFDSRTLALSLAATSLPGASKRAARL